ncbi:MAG: hypothetical protein Q9213_006506 [Squamulea squamosa]
MEDNQLSKFRANKLAASIEAPSDATTPLSNCAEKAVIPRSSAKSKIPTEEKSSVEDGSTAILTGSLNELTPNGHVSNGTTLKQEQDTTAKAGEADVCANCLAAAEEKCRQCASSWYCSAACQKADWSYHKHLCSQAKDFRDRPATTSVRAILFPENTKLPKLIWLKKNDTILDWDNIHEKVEVAEVLGVSAAEHIGQLQVTDSPNMSVGTVTKGNFQSNWRGLIVAVLTAFDDTARSDSVAVVNDMTMTDYRDLVDFFTLYDQYVEGEEDFAPTSFWWLSSALKQDLVS